MGRNLLAAALVSGLVVFLAESGSGETRKWDSKTEHRAETAAFADAEVSDAAEAFVGADNDLVGSEVTYLGPVAGGDEYEVRFIFEPVGMVMAKGDITSVVFVSDDLSDAYVVSYEAPAPDAAPDPGGGVINNTVEYDAVAEALGDAGVKAELDSRFDAGVGFLDWDAVVIGTDESGTTVDVILDSDSNEPGKGDVTATVLVDDESATVTEITAE